MEQIQRLTQYAYERDKRIIKIKEEIYEEIINHEKKQEEKLLKEKLIQEKEYKKKQEEINKKKQQEFELEKMRQDLIQMPYRLRMLCNTPFFYATYKGRGS